MVKTLPLLVTSCFGAVSDSAICAGTREPTNAHQDALLKDGGPESIVTGANLIALLDAGCGRP